MKVACCAMLTGLAAGSAIADDHAAPFEEATVLLQLNDTDGDLGFHLRLDGDPWRRVTIEGPDGRRLYDVRLRGELRRQGLTEMTFESAEPTFDELDPDELFERFPEGEYRLEGRGFDGERFDSTSELSHLIPAAPANLMVSGMPAPDDCDGGAPEIAPPIVISWDPVETSHATLGEPGEVEVDSYELAVEGESVEYTFNVEDDITSIALAMEALPSGEEVKYQVLVREADGNESSAESCFIVM